MATCLLLLLLVTVLIKSEMTWENEFSLKQHRVLKRGKFVPSFGTCILVLQHCMGKALMFVVDAILICYESYCVLICTQAPGNNRNQPACHGITQQNAQ